MRERKVKERTAIANLARGLLMEMGIIAKKWPEIFVNFYLWTLNIWKLVGHWQRMDYLSEIYSELVQCDVIIKKYEA